MSETDTDLPKTLIKRIVKRHLSQIDKGDNKRDTQINKDALLAFSESAKVFINYITATANDICKESKRQTISVDDILRALEDTDFVDLIAPLKQSIEVFKKGTKEKNQKKAEAKKRKAEQQEQQQQQEPGNYDAMDDSGQQADLDNAFSTDQQPSLMEAQPSTEPQSLQQQLTGDLQMLPPPSTARSEENADKRQKQSEPEQADIAMTDAPHQNHQASGTVQAQPVSGLPTQNVQQIVLPAALPSGQQQPNDAMQP